jgi:subtilase family serine protease
VQHINVFYWHISIFTNLNRVQYIGEHLQGHPEAAGGITDLTFRDIPIELKVENSKVLFPKDFKKYFNQTAAYAIGLGKRIGVLSVLEASQKKEPVGVVEDDIEVFVHQTGNSPILIVVVVVRGGFPKPSSYFR